MKKFLFIGLFLLTSNYLNSGTISTEKSFSQKTTIELIEEQFYKLQNIIKAQTETDVFLLKHKMYNKFTLEDKIKVTEICKKLEIEEIWLYKTIYKESHGNTKAINKISKATGIIQWLPSTARKFNTTTEELYNMSMSEQLEYVYKYYEPICKRHKLNSYLDTYLAVFHPKALGKSKDYIIGHKDSKTVKQNKSIDSNNDGIITVNEISLLTQKV